MMQLAMLCPFPVGVVAWSAPEPRRTVIVKATFGLDRDGELRLAPQQRAFDLDAPSPWSVDELGTASDFAPHKERVDVLLLGHARAPAPSTAIPAAIEVGDVRRAFVAVSSHPTQEIPLSVAHLRSEAASNVPVRVGPLPARSPARRAHAGDRPVDRDGMPLGPLGGDFDFGFFNAAPLPQQMDALPPSADLILTGLFVAAPQRVVTLPRRRPLVYLLDASERGGVALGMRCDTVIVDTDSAEISLVWRGSFDVERASSSARLLVGYEMPGTRWSADEQRDRLRFSWPAQIVEPPDQADSAAPRSIAAPPLVAAAPVTPAAIPRPPRARATLVALPFASAAVLPFVSHAPPVPPEPRAPAPLFPARFDDDEGTLLNVLPSPESARRTLPFLASTPPLVAEPLPITGDFAPPPLVPALPFEPPQTAPALVPPQEPEPAPEPIIEEPEPASVPPSRPPPPRPPKPRPQPLLAVGLYVAIRAELATGRRRDVLSRHGFELRDWKHQERMQIEALEAQALAGQTDRARALAQALEDADLA